jgi:transcriptional regulator with XRE-family HTH domain
MVKENIKLIRQAWRMSQEEFAQELGVSRNQVANWEHGRTPVDAEYLHQLGKMTGLHPNAIFQETIHVEAIPAQPLRSYVSMEMIWQKMLDIERLLTKNANE